MCCYKLGARHTRKDTTVTGNTDNNTSINPMCAISVQDSNGTTLTCTIVKSDGEEEPPTVVGDDCGSQSPPGYDDCENKEGRGGGDREGSGGGDPTVTCRSMEANQCDKDTAQMPAPTAPPTTQPNEYVEMYEMGGGATNRVAPDGEGCEDTVIDEHEALLPAGRGDT